MKNPLSRSLSYIKFSYRSRGFKYLVGEVCFIITKKILRKYFQPSLSDFNSSGFDLHHDSEQAINKILENASGLGLLEVLMEYDKLFDELQNRLDDAKFGIEDDMAKLMYLLIRIAKPDNVMETGVAKGVSTFFITNALSKNGNGSLISVDISGDVATFLNGEERKRWKLKVLNTSYNPRKQFHKILNECPPLSIYLHDGDHSYMWQRMEYDLALQKLKGGGILLSDDVDSSYAFIDSLRNSDEFSSITLKL